MGTTRQAAFHTSPITRILVALIDAYRWLLSPLIGRQCRFHPSCSCYAREAIIGHGPLHGSWLAARRLARCHPWSPGGLDEVPPSKPTTNPEPGH